MEHKIEYFQQLAQAKGYLQLFDKLYAHQPYFAPYREDIKNGLEYCLGCDRQEVYLVKILDKQGCQAHAALILDHAWPPGEAFFGFFECGENQELFAELWGRLRELARAKGANKLNGPMNGSIWHAYRVPKRNPEGFPAFPAEPLAKQAYYSYFKAFVPSREMIYYSATRERYDTLVHLTAPSAKEAIEKGYAVQKLARLDRVHLEAIWKLSCQAFKDNWGYVELSRDEFFSLYGPGKLARYDRATYMIKKEHELVGFCAAIPWQNSLILKTMAIQPEHQGQGAGNALVHAIHSEAMEKRLEKVIYALIREGNKIKHFPRDDARVIREYACFEFVLQ